MAYYPARRSVRTGRAAWWQAPEEERDKMQKIIVADEVVEVEPIIRKDGLAITHNGERFSINHRSGIAITGASTISMALDHLEILADISTPQGVKITDLPACELLALAPWVAEQFAERVEEEKAKYVRISPVQDRAARYAEILCGVAQ